MGKEMTSWLDQVDASNKKISMECGGIDTALACPLAAKAASKPPHSTKERVFLLGFMLVLLLTFFGPVAFAAPPVVIRRADLVDDGRFLAVLHEYGMTELLWTWSRDNPVPANASIAELIRQAETRRLILTSPRVSFADRVIVRRESAEILGRLIRQFPDDVRVADWRCDLVRLLMDSAEPIRRAAAFELASGADLDEMAGLLERAAAVIEPGLADLERQIERIERTTPFNAAEYDRLDPLRVFLRRCKALGQLGGAQIIWARAAGWPAESKFGRTLEAGRDACEKEFGKLTVPQALADEKDPARRALALRAVAAGRLYAGQPARAAEPADRLTRDAAIDPLDRLEGYALWAQAMRSAGQFGGRFTVSADDVLNWPTVCGDLARQANRSTRCPLKRVWELLPPDGQAAIRANANIVVEPPAGDQGRIVAGLNAVLARPDLFTAADFVDVTLSAEGSRLRDLGPGNLTGPQRVRLNRELLDRTMGTSLAGGKPGARTVLDEAEAFVASQPALRADGLSLLRVRLAMANNLSAQAITSARTNVTGTYSGEFAPGIVERYRAAKRAGEALVRTAVDRDPNAGPNVKLVLDRMMGDAALDAAVAKRQAIPATQPGLPAAVGTPGDKGAGNSATQPAASEPDDEAAASQPQTQADSQPSTQPVRIYHYWRKPPDAKPPEEGPTPGKIVLGVVLGLLCLACVVALRRSRFRRRAKKD